MEEPEVDINSETYKREIECLKIEFSSIFAAKNISVSVVRFEKKEGGLYVKSISWILLKVISLIGLIYYFFSIIGFLE